MPRVVTHDNERMNLPVQPDVKARLVQAATLRHIAEAEQVTVR